MNDDDDLDIFEDLEEVEQSRGSSPRLLQVIAALLVVGLIVGIAASVIVSGIASVSPQRVEPGSVVCGGGAAICDDLTLDQVRSLTGIPFGDDATVEVSQYAETDSKITVTATVVLADGSANPLEESYGIIATPTLDWPSDGLTVLDYYAASGEGGSLYAEALHAVDDRVREVVLVEVVRTL